MHPCYEYKVDDYRALFDANPRPLLVSDRETLKILEANRAACDLYGWSRDELLGMTLRDIRPVEYLPFFEAMVADNQQGLRAARGGRHRTKSGGVIDVSVEMSITTFRGRAALLILVNDITGINDAERRFRLLVEHSNEGISLTNATGVAEYVSPGGLRALGYQNASELTGKSAGFRVHPDDIATWKPPGPGETARYVSRMMHRDGSWRWIESVTTNLTLDPAIRAYVSNYHDITPRVDAEKALRESQQRLEFLLSATSAVTYSASVDVEFTTTFIGANAKEQFGYAPEEFYATRLWFEGIHPDDIGTILGVTERLRKTREPLDLQYRFRHRDGTYRWIRDNVRIVHDEGGHSLELVGFMIDATDAVRAEEAVRRSEVNFRTLIERAPIATFVHRDGKYVYVNAAGVALLGHADACDLVGQSILDNVPLSERETLRNAMSQVNTRGATAFSGLRILRANGTTFVAEGEAMLLDFDGHASHVVMCHDVTERDAIFARIATADRMLSVGTLAAGVAHEINNPLAFIATNLELLAAELPHMHLSANARLNDTTLHRLVSDSREGVRRVNAIVRDLRSLSRPGEEQTRGPIDVAAVLATSLKMTNNEIRHRARVVQDLNQQLPAVVGDASRLGQVFVNLLLNGAQAIVEGGAEQNEIRIRTSIEGKRVRIDISDSGAGIPAPVLPRIFDPFFTTKEPGTGMGLGLAISHQIVQSMEGEITVSSKVGAGSTFTVWLPIATCNIEPEVHEREAARRSTQRLLIIDDEPAVGRSLQMLLAPETDVVAVVSAEDALAHLRRGESYDAILCDLMMPHSSGMQLYEQVGNIRPEYQSRIIFMTGGAFTPQARAFLSKLGRPHLEKPFSEQELRDAIANVLH